MPFNDIVVSNSSNSEMTKTAIKHVKKNYAALTKRIRRTCCFYDESKSRVVKAVNVFKF